MCVICFLLCAQVLSQPNYFGVAKVVVVIVNKVIYEIFADGELSLTCNSKYHGKCGEGHHANAEHDLRVHSHPVEPVREPHDEVCSRLQRIGKLIAQVLG